MATSIWRTAPTSASSRPSPRRRRLARTRPLPAPPLRPRRPRRLPQAATSRSTLAPTSRALTAAQARRSPPTRAFPFLRARARPSPRAAPATCTCRSSPAPTALARPPPRRSPWTSATRTPAGTTSTTRAALLRRRSSARPPRSASPSVCKTPPATEHTHTHRHTTLVVTPHPTLLPWSVLDERVPPRCPLLLCYTPPSPPPPLLSPARATPLLVHDQKK